MAPWNRVLAAAIAVATVAAAAGQNLLLNGGFEEVTADGRPAAWSVSGKAELISDPALAHGGQRCAKGRFEDGLSQRLDAASGRSYRISGWIRRANPTGSEVPKIKVYFHTAAGQDVGGDAAEIPGVTADAWHPWQSVTRVPDSATRLTLTLRGLFGGSEFFYWDDVSVEAVTALEWPAWETTPDLNGTTVSVPDLADVLSEAVMRWFPVALAPLDGRLDTSVTCRGQDVIVKLGTDSAINHVLIHTLKPLVNLREAAVTGTGAAGERELFRVGDQDALITSARFPAVSLRELRVAIPPPRTVFVTEIQAFHVESGTKALSGTAQRLGVEASPESPPTASPAAARTLLAAATVVGAGTVALKAGAVTVIRCRGAAQEYGVNGISLVLALGASAPQALLEIGLRQAAELDLDIGEAELIDRAGGGPDKIPASRREPRAQACVFRVLSQVPATGTLTFGVDIPDTVFGKDEPVLLTLRPQTDVTLDLAASNLTLQTLPVAEALPEYLPRLERLLQRLHAQGTEAHAWGSYQTGYMGYYLRRVLELKPDSKVAALVWNHVGGRRTNVALTRPGPADAPDWAVWEQQVLRNLHGVVLWWLDQRQRSDGQLGGHINDDGEFSCRWPTDYLITGEPRIRIALQKLADVAWAMSNGKGYTVGSTDVEHAAEDQSCTQPQVLLTNYGSPQAVERLLVMSQHLEFWTAINQVGRRQFKSFMFTADRVWEDPPYDVDHAYCPLAMVGAGHAVWYAQMAGLRQLFLEEAESWRLAVLSTDKGKAAGVVPHEVRFRDSEILPYAPYTKDNPRLKGRDGLYGGGAGQYIVVHLLQGASALTGEEKYAAPLQLTEAPAAEQLKAAASTLALYQQKVRPPPDGPERRYSVSVTAVQGLQPPLRLLRDGQAVGALTADGQAGECTVTVEVPEPGRYAFWASIGRSDATETGTASFFADLNGVTDRLIGSVAAGQWAAVTGRQTFDLPAGPQTFRLRPRTPGSALREVGFTTQYSLDGSWNPSQDETKLYQAWKLSGDKQWLTEELQEAVRQQERTRWLATEAEPYTDRIYWPGEQLMALLCLGGTVAQKSHVPLNWISWEGGGTDLTALVLDARTEHLKVLCCSLAEAPRALQMRSWRLPHGRYRFTLGIDRNADDAADEVLQDRTLTLARYDAIEFSAQPKRVYVLELSLVERLGEVASRPDLGLDPADVRLDGQALQVTAHNLGASASPATVVRLVDAAGKTLAEAALPALAPPLDLQPKTAVVRLALAGAVPAGARVVLDPDDAIAEITEINNAVGVPEATGAAPR